MVAYCPPYGMRTPSNVCLHLVATIHPLPPLAHTRTQAWVNGGASTHATIPINRRDDRIVSSSESSWLLSTKICP